MQYALLLYEDETIYGSDRSGPAVKDLLAKHVALRNELGPQRLFSSGLKPTEMTTTVKIAEGNRTVHDGPFAEAREQLAGLYVVDVPDLDAAIAVAKKFPLLKNGSIEIRPLLGAA
ncbi:YciI family protein [Microvirga puerhi]|uniref:YciI family protein n=1 Tax=Microvirga puerhi TaxID=2876078 RepID=A0ABS7VID4_9HYPH|nr:YciI family protein [Microvirga puerhi]MBZ6075254.1 YciI family protein [Microvirga puerhi]